MHMNFFPEMQIVRNGAREAVILIRWHPADGLLRFDREALDLVSSSGLSAE
jgi:hypothetical protein